MNYSQIGSKITEREYIKQRLGLIKDVLEGSVKKKKKVKLGIRAKSLVEKKEHKRRRMKMLTSRTL